MKPRLDDGRPGRRKGLRRGLLLFGAFLAGLLTVGVALFLPDEGRKDPASPSLFSPPPPPPANSAAPEPPRPGETPPRMPRLALVVDDLGYEPSRDAEWLKFPDKMTVAVLPFGPSSRNVAESARAKGWTVLLHAPMEPESPAPDRTEGFRFRPGMSAEEMDALLSRMVAALPGVSGTSNHMGSAFTADPGAMATFVALLANKRLYLLDSVTTPKSVALDAAQRAGLPAARRDVFLDAGMGPQEMRRQWDRAVTLAKEKGTAILVCHPNAEILRLVVALLPGLRGQGVSTATLDELLGTPAGIARP